MAGPTSNVLTVISIFSVQVIAQVQFWWYGYGNGHSGEVTVPASDVKSPPQFAIYKIKKDEISCI